MDSRDNNGSNGETRYQMETEDGFLVSVPESKLESWLEAQSKPPHSAGRNSSCSTGSCPSSTARKSKQRQPRH